MTFLKNALHPLNNLEDVQARAWLERSASRKRHTASYFQQDYVSRWTCKGGPNASQPSYKSGDHKNGNY